MFTAPAFFLFFFGLCVGSFVNVLTFRFGYSESKASRSHCMACAKEIAWYDLVPVLSFVALQGRCRSCGSSLSLQYPIVEILTGSFFLLAYLTQMPVFTIWSLVAFAALLMFIAAFIGLSAYDIRHTLVPMPFVYALILSAFTATAAQSIGAHSWEPLIEGAIGGAALFGFFFAIILTTRGRGMGMGDAYVGLAIGLLFGLFRGTEAVMIGIWSGALVGLLLIFLSSRRRAVTPSKGASGVTMKTELPLIPFLAFGAGVALCTVFSPIAFVSSLVGLFVR